MRNLRKVKGYKTCYIRATIAPTSAKGAVGGYYNGLCYQPAPKLSKGRPTRLYLSSY